jgi:hypothetical protein
VVTEPIARALHVVAFRAAALEMWGPTSWDEVLDGLPRDSREALWQGGIVVATGWVAERHMVKLAEAVYQGPAHGSMEVYRNYIQKVIELGFGRVRRLLVQFAHPHTVLRRAPELWRHDHSHGELTIEIEEKSALTVVTHDVLTATQLSRATCAEMFRAVLSLTKAKEVKQEHGLDADGRLRVLLKWV